MPDIAAPITLEPIEGTPVIDWIKLADDGSGDIVARLYEAAGAKAKAMLHVGGTLDGWTVRETNTLEQDEPTRMNLPDLSAASSKPKAPNWRSTPSN